MPTPDALGRLDEDLPKPAGPAEGQTRMTSVPKIYLLSGLFELREFDRVSAAAI